MCFYELLNFLFAEARNNQRQINDLGLDYRVSHLRFIIQPMRLVFKKVAQLAFRVSVSICNFLISLARKIGIFFSAKALFVVLKF